MASPITSTTSQRPFSAEGRASSECAGPDVLAKHLAVLAQNTKHRNPSENADVRKIATHRMVVMLMEFPARIALAAIDRWPNTMEGEWYPTEHHLRLLCVSIQQSLKPAAPPSHPTPEFAHPESHRTEMKRKLWALLDWMRTGNTHGIPELEEAQRKKEAREAAAEAAGFCSVAHWMGNKR